MVSKCWKRKTACSTLYVIILELELEFYVDLNFGSDLELNVLFESLLVMNRVFTVVVVPSFKLYSWILYLHSQK